MPIIFPTKTYMTTHATTIARDCSIPDFLIVFILPSSATFLSLIFSLVYLIFKFSVLSLKF